MTTALTPSRPIPRPFFRGPAVVASVVTQREPVAAVVEAPEPVVRRIKDGRRQILCRDLPETRAFAAPESPSRAIRYRPVQVYRAARISGGEWIDVEASSYEVAEQVAMERLQCDEKDLVLRYVVTRCVCLAKGE